MSKLTKLPYTTTNGTELYASRRRYSGRTFTWVDVKVNGEFLTIGDPWPCITPKRAEVVRDADLFLQSLPVTA